jgi:hypothetical protein
MTDHSKLTGAAIGALPIPDLAYAGGRENVPAATNSH